VRLHVIASERIIFVSICCVKIKIPEKTMSFHWLPPCGCDNAIGIFRKFFAVVQLTARTMELLINFMGTERVKSGISRSILGIILDMKQILHHILMHYISFSLDDRHNS
jgi:hypothetical protein